jgi:hypothetical protein
VNTKSIRSDAMPNYKNSLFLLFVYSIALYALFIIATSKRCELEHVFKKITFSLYKIAESILLSKFYLDFFKYL